MNTQKKTKLDIILEDYCVPFLFYVGSMVVAFQAGRFFGV